jgi:hypothetical protein
MTDLIIQTLTEDDARTLKEKIFCERGLAKVIKGSYSGTFGLKVSFEDWFSSEYSETVAKFLYKEPVIKMKPSELGYYEYGTGWNYCEEVDFSELFPKAGFYSFDKEGVVKLQQNIGRIYYRDNHICSVNDTSVIRYWIERDPIFKSGISKMYRRGFIDKETKYKWINEIYPDTLQDC